MESNAKLYIQELIRNKKIDLVSSYMLLYENSLNPFLMRKNPIKEFININTVLFIPYEKHVIIEKMASEIMDTGIKFKDACHIACSLLGQCSFFITTDKRLLKYKCNNVKVINPIDFVRELEENNGS